MAHLPPKPDFEVPPPSRYPPDYRSYARPPPPLSPPPDRVYRERSAYPPRSPPRSRVSGDSYVASRPVDTHRSSRPSMDSYVASYDRRDDDRYRDAPYREREPPPREREWERRERDYAPPEYRHRPREPSRERVDWAREREADRLRRWEEYERHHDRRTHERRDYNPPRARDADWRREDDRRYARDRPPPEPERMWIPRASKSPPRRMVPHAAASTSTPLRGRSPPSPRPRHRSPSPRQPSRPRSPSPRSAHRRPRDYWSPADERKLGNHSISLSPQHPLERSPRSTGGPDRRDRSRDWRSRSRSRRADSRESRYPSGRAAHTEQPHPPPSPRRAELSAHPAGPSTRPRSRSRTPVKDREEFHPSRPLRIHGERGAKIEPDTDQDVKMRDISPLPASSTRESGPQSRRRRSRSLVSSRIRAHTPSSPASPQVSQSASGLPQRPEQTRRSTTVSSTTPKAEVVSPTQNAPEPLITAPVIPPYKAKPSEIEVEIARIQARHAPLLAEYEALSRATRRALFEVDVASIDLRLAESRRQIAEKQVEKARAGVLGIDYVAEVQESGQ